MADDSDSAAHIRLAATADLDTVVALTRQAYAVYKTVIDGPPVPVTEDYAPHIAKGNVWMLEVDGQSAGLIVVEREPDHLLIFSVVVADAFQGRGLGSRLMQWAETLARREGLDLIRLYTNARMTRNIAIYQGMGYREIGRSSLPQWPERIKVDMEKRLS